MKKVRQTVNPDQRKLPFGIGTDESDAFIASLRSYYLSRPAMSCIDLGDLIGRRVPSAGTTARTRSRSNSCRIWDV